MFTRKSKQKPVKHFLKTIMELSVDTEHTCTIEFVDGGIQVTETAIPVSRATVKEVNIYEY